MAYVSAIESHPEQARILRDEIRARTRLHVTSSPEDTVDNETAIAGPQVLVLPRSGSFAAQVTEYVGVPEPTSINSRSAMRTEMVDWASMLVNGTEVELLDLSATGAQIRSPQSLTPGNPVQVMLKSGADSVQCRGKVVWGVPETTLTGGYRAGLTFAAEDRKSVEWLWDLSVRRQQ